MHLRIPLHPIADRIAAGITKGRSIRDGYARGYSTVPDNFANCQKDPLFNLAFEAMENRTVVTPQRLMNIYFLITHFFEHLDCQKYH